MFNRKNQKYRTLGMRKFFTSKDLDREKGFTLVEVLVAVAILTVGLLAVGTMQLTSIRGNFMSGNTTTALTLASQKMEDLLNRTYSDAALTDTTAANNTNLSSITTTDHEEGVNQNGQVAAGGFYRRIWNIADSSGSMPTSKAITVIVTWEGNKHKVSVSCLRKP